MKKGIRLTPKDNVGVVIQDVAVGDQVSFEEGLTITALDAIVAPHKMALVELAAGDSIYKYGEVIGYATQTIAPGTHVHDHNCDSEKLMK